VVQHERHQPVHQIADATRPRNSASQKSDAHRDLSPSRQNPWDDYWETLSDDARLFREQAREYARLLCSTLALQPSDRLFDFGCGFGFAARELASQVGSVCLWDASASMRNHARANVSALHNARVIDCFPDADDSADHRYDVILVNSVIQYMTHDELRQWIQGWRDILAPEGRIVVSDIIPVEYSSVLDIVDILNLSIRRGFAMRALADGSADIFHYIRQRHTRPLTRYGHDDLRRSAHEAGLSMSVLPRNVTHFRRRTSVMLTDGVASIHGTV
jgi:cyclopropane fatty-acyl-phospholipid synthase-like methyltransferase